MYNIVFLDFHVNTVFVPEKVVRMIKLIFKSASE